jgi:Rrf2 family protein
MRLSAKEQYGVRAMVELARHYGQGPVSLAQVAEIQQLPLPYLEQIMSPLRQAGLLTSSRGAYGGYELSRPPEAISVGDVIRALEGQIVSIPCIQENAGAHCRREDVCAVRNVWETVHQRLADTLNDMTLAGLLDAEGAPVADT